MTDLASPLLLSLLVASTATALVVIVAVPSGLILARWKHPLVFMLESALLLPLLLPPTVVGYVLLLIFGRNSPVGAILEEIGLPVLFTWRGAVLASATVSLPLAVLPVKAAVAAIDRDFEDIAATLGYGRLGTVWHVFLPLARQGIAAGALLAFARSLGEFGATLMLCGMIPGRTMTLSLSIYHAHVVGRNDQALGAALILSGIALAAIVIQRHGLGPRQA